MKVKSLSRLQLLPTAWTVAHQASPSMGFYRPEYWSGLPFPPPTDLPNPGIKPVSLASLVLASRFFTIRTTGKAPAPEKPAKNVGISTLSSGIPSARKGTRTGSFLHFSWMTGLISGAGRPHGSLLLLRLVFLCAASIHSLPL